MSATSVSANADAPAEREAACPYPGLEAFTAENRHFFFGRANDTQLLISNLYASPLTVVYGSSGVGKTSVILAGVVPEVEREGDAAILVHRTWQDAARSRSLGARLAQQIGAALGEPAMDADAPLDVLAGRLAARWRRPIFLVFDQFEEYFLYNEASDNADSLDGELARLINRRDLDVNVMIVLREDSLAALDRFRHRIPTLLNNLYRLEHLTADEARDAIEKPLAELATRADPTLELPVSFEPGLSTAVLDDLTALNRGDASSAMMREEARVELPFLQVVLERLWLLECRARSPIVRRSTFSGAGGARGIVRERIQEALDRIDPEEREIVATVLRHLVTPSGAKIALTLADLAGYARVDEERVAGVVGRLVAGDARVLRRVPHPSGDAALTKYEIYHDALGAPLQAWRAEMDRRRDDTLRRAKRRDRLVRGAAVLLAAMVVSSILIVKWVLAAKDRVEARELATIAGGQLDTDNGRALLLALSSIERSEREQAGEVVLRRALFEPGERQRALAPAAVQRVIVSPDGRYAMGTSPHGQSALWLLDSLSEVSLPTDIRDGQMAAFDSASRNMLVVDASRPMHFSLDSTPRITNIPKLIGSVPAGTLLKGGDRALLVYAGSGVVEWVRNGTEWQEVSRTPTRGGVPRALAVSADERWVAWVGTGSVSIADRQLQPWGVQELVLPGSRPTQVQFVSPREIAVADGSESVRVYDVASRTMTDSFRLSCKVSRFAFANGEAAGICGDSGVVLFNLPHMRSQMRMGSEPPLVSRSSPISDVVLSPDGRLMLWLPKNDFVASVWSVYSRSEITRLRGHRGRITAATFLNDSRRVLTTAADSTVRVWEVVSAAQRIGDGEFMGGRATVAIDAAADRVAMIGPYGLQLWDVAKGRTLVEAPIPDVTEQLSISSAGDRVATFDGGAALLEFSDANAAERRVELPLANADVVNRAGRALPLYGSTSLLRYAGPALVLSSVRTRGGATDSTMMARVPPGGAQVEELAHAGASAVDLATDSAGTRAAFAMDDGRVYAVDLAERAAPQTVATHVDRATTVAFALSGLIASGGSSGDVRIAAPVARPSARLPSRGLQYGPADSLGAHERGIARLAFNRTATVLASGDEGGTVRLWSVSSRRELCSLEGQHADYIRDIAFAPSGRTVATADESGVALWFVDDGAGTCHFGYRLVDLESPTQALRFAPDGSALVVVGRDGVIRRYTRNVWAPRDSLVALAKRRLRGRTLTDAEIERYTKSH